jgi:hypothetical protein
LKFINNYRAGQGCKECMPSGTLASIRRKQLTCENDTISGRHTLKQESTMSAAEPVQYLAAFGPKR